MSFHEPTSASTNDVTPATQSPGLCDLAASLEMAQAKLDIVNEFSQNIRDCENLGKYQREHLLEHCEQLETRLLGTMLELSDKASMHPACTPNDLKAKARIWLSRYVPDADDDVTLLAASICRDILQMDPEDLPQIPLPIQTPTS